MKFATKPIQYYPPHLRHVAILPWEIKKSIVCRYSADIEKMEILIKSEGVHREEVD